MSFQGLAKNVTCICSVPPVHVADVLFVIDAVVGGGADGGDDGGRCDGGVAAASAARDVGKGVGNTES